MEVIQFHCSETNNSQKFIRTKLANEKEETHKNEKTRQISICNRTLHNDHNKPLG